MKKQIVALFLAYLAISSALNVQQSIRANSLVKKTHVISKQVKKFEVDLCPTCIQFSTQTINILLNIILNSGVIGSCGYLCELVGQETGSRVIETVCNVLCDLAGVEEFIRLVERADLDPIYLCELLDACPVFDGGDAVITKITVDPISGPQGNKKITIDFSSKNGTGTGELIVAVRTVDGVPVENGFLQEPLAPGRYSEKMTLKAIPDPDCDPTQQMCEQWLPGDYTLITEICNGECGSKHPHSKVYDRKHTNFTITN